MEALPSAVMIVDGRIASLLAAGGDTIRGLGPVQHRIKSRAERVNWLVALLLSVRTCPSRLTLVFGLAAACPIPPHPF